MARAQSRPASATAVQQTFSLEAMGWLSFALAILLSLGLVVSLALIIPFMTETQGHIKDLSERVSARIAPAVSEAAAESPSGQADPLLVQTAQIVTALEFDSMTIRTQGIQVALGLVAGLICIVFGLLLFAVGVTGLVRATAQVGPSMRFSVASVMPGVVFALIGGLVTYAAVSKDVRRTFSMTGEFEKREPGLRGGYDIGPINTSAGRPPDKPKDKEKSQEKRRPKGAGDEPKPAEQPPLPSTGGE